MTVMHRRQLLARVLTTGLVLAGGSMSISAVDLTILLKARDEASNRLSQIRPYQKGPYFVGERGPELFIPHTPAGKSSTAIDYERLAKAIARAIDEMPPPRIVQ